MTDTLAKLLKIGLADLKKAKTSINYSYNKCHKIGIKKNYTEMEAEHFEAFTSRFARVSDILIQKVYRLIDKLELEDNGTVKDRLNRAEKKGLISDAEILVEIRLLRNDIAHEYESEGLKQIYKKVFKLYPKLIGAVVKADSYSKKFF